MGVISHSYLVLFGDNGVCVFSALTSGGALFLFNKWCDFIQGEHQIDG